MKICYTLAIYSTVVGVAFAKGSPDSVIDDKVIQPSNEKFLRGAGKDAFDSRKLDWSTSDDEDKHDVKPVDGYVGVNTGGCKGKNELGTIWKQSVYSCAISCDANEKCVSFEFGKDQKPSSYFRCALSKTCYHREDTAYNKNDSNFLYVKADKVPEAEDVNGYEALNTGGCIGKNELGTSKQSTAGDCAAECNKKSGCVSFEFGKINRRCALSKTCDKVSLTVNSDEDSNYLYIKHNKVPEAQIEGAFAVLDTDESGSIDREEFEKFNQFLPSGLSLSAAQLDDMMGHGDANGDGKMSYEEFNWMMKTYHY